YDHKYIYSHLGYNLKPFDPQAAIGRVQLKKLPAFVEARRSNWHKLRAGLDDLQDVFEFSLPTHATGWSDGEFSWDSSGCRSEPSWFGFMLLVHESAPFTRTDVARYLDSRGVGNRMLFGGNLVRQPVFHELAGRRPDAFRYIGSLQGADAIMNRALFIGVYPGLDDRQIAHVSNVLHGFREGHCERLSL
ncbi:MAG: DegT/DnrJ/EryC1/StrS family aminotransferase, partial [Chloroflexi bacterium]|nr:DegT/DnrJ/EryC1/StrS family aminotransferase [Chloroflexota bacterium]